MASTSPHPSSPSGLAPTALWRILLWAAPLGLLTGVAVIGRTTDQMNWTALDFGLAALLLYSAVGAFDGLTRVPGPPSYRAGAAVAVLGALGLLWGTIAVGLTDSDADILYFGVVAVGVAAAVAGRGRPGAMVRAMLATAAALAAVSLGAIAAGVLPPATGPGEVLGVTAVFAALFLGAAALFHASTRPTA